jgi:hypothetical protein
MAKAKVNVAAFNNTFKELDDVFIKRITKIENAFRKSLNTMAENAKADAPIDVTGPHPGRLADSIQWDEPAKLSFELRAEAPYAAYVEFGTGENFSRYPGKDEYWQTIAKKYYVNGKGWTRPQPFFYHNVNKELPKLIKRINKILGNNEG